MLKRTKIIATLGPASSSHDTIANLIRAGANVFRLNFSHGSHQDHRQRATLVRETAAELGAHIALLGDLQGPKVRIGAFADAGVQLEEGDSFTLDCNLALDQGNSQVVGVTYAELANDCIPGQVLLLDDGRIELEITAIDHGKLHTQTVIGGLLTSNKGINLRGGGLSAQALTEKDFRDIKLAAELDLDYLAISFPRSAEDMHSARAAAEAAGCKAQLVSKIERAEAVADHETLDDLIRASDAVMVARGDLGVEIGDAELIGVQKKIILRARQLNRAVITATQMMETMINNSLPTRAEVFDVANAVLDGTDAVMLSAETATGKHPVKVVEAMTRIIIGAEKQPANKKSGHRMDRQFEQVEESIAMATMYAANHLEAVKGILCLTESGSTPMWMSRIRSGLPIFAVSGNPKTLNRMCLYRGVTPFMDTSGETEVQTVITNAIVQIKKARELTKGDLVLCTYGGFLGQDGKTNTLKIITVD